jgi:hypothetical protein
LQQLLRSSNQWATVGNAGSGEFFLQPVLNRFRRSDFMKTVTTESFLDVYGTLQ